jgi:thiol-disulfide isomerase/thioredoxin
LLLLTTLVVPTLAEDQADGPTNAKAQKTYKQGMDFLKQRDTEAALDNFKKADKQDDGHCRACQEKMIKYGMERRDWKTAETAGQEVVAEAQGPKETALAHYQLAVILQDEGIDRHKDELLTQAHEEISKALAASSNFPDAYFSDGLILARLNQDDAAKKQFEQFVAMRPADDPLRQRALRYISDPDMARARMAPAFAVTAANGDRMSLDDLKGKVVLIDFWATWCEPCREALPHVRQIVKRFDGQPLVVLSVNLDEDQQKWKDFISKNEMTWPQYCDGGFKGPIATMFGVHAIPQTFTIDADGVLQDQHIGDASIEGKLKKLIAKAQVAQTGK